MSKIATNFGALTKESLIYGMGIVSTRFVGLLLLPLYTRLFTPAEYGVLDLLTTTGVVLAIFTELQIVSGVARGYYEAKAEGHVHNLVGTAITLYICNTVLWTIIGIGVFHLWGDKLGVSVGWGHVLPVLLGLLPNQLFVLLQIVLRFEAQPKKFVLTSVLNTLTSATLSLLAVVWLDLGVAGVLWGYFVSASIFSAILLFLRRHYFALRYDKKYARQILGYSLPIVPSVLTKWGQNYANRFVLVLALSLSDLGIFSVAVRLSAVVAMVDTAFRLAWDPYAMRLFGEKNSEPVFARVFSIYQAGMFAVCSIIAFLGIWVVGMFLGKAYIGAGSLVGFLAFGSLWNGATNILGAGNGWARRTYWNGLGFAIGAALNVTLLYWAAPRWGLLAAGATYLLASVIAAWIVLLTAQRNHYIPYNPIEICLASIGSFIVAYSAYYLDFSPMVSAFPIAAQVALRLAFILIIITAIIIITWIRGADWRGGTFWQDA